MKTEPDRIGRSPATSRPAVVTAGLAQQVADLYGPAEPHPTEFLSQLTELIVRNVPGCSGAAGTVWQGGEVVAETDTHPDVADLVTAERELREGPLLLARHSGATVYCADTLNEPRWPVYASAAARRGVRCCTALAHHHDGVTVTLGLYGVRPHALDPGGMPLATMLAATAGHVFTAAARAEDTRNTIYQLHRALRTRAVVEQAKGILIEALGCTSGQAFARLRDISQTRHLKVTVLARMLVESPNRQRAVLLFQHGGPPLGEPLPQRRTHTITG